MTRLQTAMSAAQISGKQRFIGPPCKRCTNPVRYASNGRCIDCSMRITREWHAERKAKAV